MGVFDIDNTTGSVITRDFLSNAEKQGQTLYTTEDIPRSFIITERGGNKSVFLSQLSPGTLLLRSQKEGNN